MVEGADLREELRADFLALHPETGPSQGTMANLMRRLYDERMKLTGQVPQRTVGL